MTPDSKISDLLECDLSAPIEQVVNLNELDILRKKENQELLVRNMFREYGASLNRGLRLEGCSYTTDFDEDQFVQYYPYLPHLVDLSIDIAAGIRKHAETPKRLSSTGLSIPEQCFLMLASKNTRLADATAGALASIDKIYDLLEGSLPVEKQDDVRVIGETYAQHGAEMGWRVAKAICMMEFARTKLARTPANIAALLIQDVTEGPATCAVRDALEQMRSALFVNEGKNGWTLHELEADELHATEELRRALGAVDTLRKHVGRVNPRRPGWRNDMIQSGKKLLARSLNWYTRPLNSFNAAANLLLAQMIDCVDDLSTQIVSLRTRLAESERIRTDLQTELASLRDEMRAIGGQESQQRPASLRPGAERRGAHYRTAYIVGLFGTGRVYLCDLIQKNIEERSRYLRDGIRFHPVPTPMIYSGHATFKYVCRGQRPPGVMSRVLQAQRAGFADLIFVYRHPLDSLLTNWIWWRKHIRDQICISGISQVYAGTDDLCTDLEQNFDEFEAFAEGDPGFFPSMPPGPPFLSIARFVEETQLHLEAGATLAVRLEDCVTDPLKEFSKVAQVLGTPLDPNQLDIEPPRSKPYGYVSVANRVPEFRKFINGLDAKTKSRIEMLGYSAEI